MALTTRTVALGDLRLNSLPRVSATEMARAMSVSVGYISQIERGLKAVSPEQVTRYTSALLALQEAKRTGGLG